MKTSVGQFECDVPGVAEWLDVAWESSPNTGGCVTDALIGSKATRYGPLPCLTNYNYLSDVVHRYVKKNAPIDVVVMWGAAKGYARFRNHLHADVADLLALRRMKKVNDEVRQHYPPGVVFRIVWENLTELMMSPLDLFNVNHAASTYRKGLQRLADGLGVGNDIAIVDELGLIYAHGGDPQKFIDQARAAGQLLYAQYLAGEASGWKDVEHTAEYQALQAAGWNGVVTKDKWDHYAARARNERPNDSHDSHVVGSALYLGIALARAKHRMVRPVVTDDDGGIPPVKLSLDVYPPGTDEALYRGRVERKLKDGKASHRCVPPWAGYGRWDGDLHLVSVSQMPDVIESSRVEHVTVNNGLRVPILIG